MPGCKTCFCGPVYLFLPLLDNRREAADSIIDNRREAADSKKGLKDGK